MTEEKRSILNKDELKDGAKVNFLGVLNALKIDVTGTGWCRCPNPQHKDEHMTNARINLGNNWNGSVKCFACGYFADSYQLVKDLTGKETDPEIWEFLSPVIGVPVKYSDGTTFVPSAKAVSKKTEKERLLENLSREEDLSSYRWTDYRRYYLACHDALVNRADGKAGLEYFHKRGISDELIKRLRLGYDYTFRAPRVIIPITKSFYLGRDIRPSLTKNEERFSKIKPKGEKIAIFNPGALDGKKPVFIVEGEFDALSIMEMGHQAISLGGVANIDSLIKIMLRKKKAGQALPVIILALDADDAGRKAARKFIKETKTLELLDWGKNAFYCNLDDKTHVDDIYRGCKDANELLIKNRKVLGEVLDFTVKKCTA